MGRAHGSTARYKRGKRIISGRFENVRRWKIDLRAAQTRERRGRVNKEQFRTRIAHDVLHHVERLCREDRHDDAACEERREVAYDPIDAIMRDQCNTISVLETHVANSARQILDAFEQTFG